MQQTPMDRAHVTLASFIHVAPCAIAILDRDGCFIEVNARWLANNRISRDETMGRSVFELLPQIYIHVFQAALEGARLAGECKRLFRMDGSVYDADWSMGPWRNEEGLVSGVIISIVKLGQDDALQPTNRAEDRLRTAVELAGIYVWEIDRTKKTSWSAGAADTFFDGAYGLKQFEADSWGTIHPDDRQRVLALAKEQLRTDGRYIAEYRLNRNDKVQWVRGGCVAIQAEDGSASRYVGVLQDVTERRTAELAAEYANEAKSNFVANMSHEIRTPLNGVLGMVQAMAADPLPDIQRDRLKVIHQSGEALLVILNDILDFSKIEAGMLEIEAIEFDLAEIMRGVHATFEAVAERKGLRFQYDLNGADGVYRGDPIRVRQILSNLVSNALKFTEQGEVRLTATLTVRGLEVCVQDSGIGIPADRMAALFTSFSQVDASTTRRFGGTGLGLAICRRLAVLMGGEVTVETELGQGSRFTASLPLERIGAGRSDKPAADKTPRHDRPPVIRVLAAEDNAVNRLVLQTLLNQVGIDPVIVEDGAMAVEAWEREDWDVILMDVQMPVMDGMVATATIRQREAAGRRRRTPIIALTANAMSHQVAAYLAAGMDAHIAKPIDVAKLFEALEAALDMVSESQDAQVA